MCDCVNEVNKKVGDKFNAQLDVGFPFDEETLSFTGEPRTKVLLCGTDRKKPKTKYVMATYCPFCGVKYTNDKPSSD